MLSKRERELLEEPLESWGAMEWLERWGDGAAFVLIHRNTVTHCSLVASCGELSGFAEVLPGDKILPRLLEEAILLARKNLLERAAS